MWEFQQFEIEFGNEGEHSIDLPVYENLNEAEQHLLLIVERLGADAGGEFDVSVGAQVEQISRVETVRTFVGQAWRDSRSVLLRIRTRGVERIRVTWASFTKKLGEAAAWMGEEAGRRRCKICKVLAQALAMAALSAVGSHFALGTTLILTPDQLAALDKLGSFGPFGNFLEASGTGPIWGVLKGLLQAVDQIFEFTDRLFGRICETAGLCP